MQKDNQELRGIVDNLSCTLDLCPFELLKDRVNATIESFVM